MNSDPLTSRRRLFAVVAVLILVLAASGTAVKLSETGETASDSSLQFREVSSDVGVDYVTTGSDLGNGDGAVLVTDYNRDGWQDILLLGGDEPALYRNNRSGGFTKTDALPAVEQDQLKSGLFFDYDNDGWQDLLLLPRHGPAVFLENQQGTFQHASVGLNVNLTWGTSAVSADYDDDGCLDLFITQNGDWSERVPNRSSDNPIDPDNGEPNMLFDGNCDTFERVNGTGIEGTRWSLTASFVDFTGNGHPDIHVANDFNYDRLYINQGNGSFESRRIPNTNRHAMTSEVEDVNGDGRLDIFVTNIEFGNPSEVWAIRSGFEMVNRGNNLLVNQGNGTFEDRATDYGVRRGGWGWAGNLVDLDNDGNLDLIHATQTYLVSQDGNWREVKTRPAVWERKGDSFERLNASERGFVPANGRGLAVLDFDRDGDQDIVVADTEGSFKVYENVGTTGNWIQVDVRAEDGVVQGTRVTAIADNETRTQVRDSKVNFFSQSTRVLHFGLENADRVDLRVKFPDGTVRRFEDVRVGKRVVVSKNGSIRPVGK